MTNVGPGLGASGNYGHYSALPDVAEITMILLMIIGRLEILYRPGSVHQVILEELISVVTAEIIPYLFKIGRCAAVKPVTIIMKICHYFVLSCEHEVK